MRIRFGILLLAFAFGASADAPPPSATTLHGCECVVRLPTSAPDVRGTKAAPLEIRVAPEADVKAHELWDRKRAEIDTGTNQRIANFTLALVIATIVLACVGSWQGWLIQQQVALGRSEFVSTNRPRIALREAYIDAPNPNEPITVKYMLSNLGGTDATIVRSSFKVERLALQAQKRQVQLGPSNVEGLTLNYAAGAFAECAFAAVTPWTPDPVSVQDNRRVVVAGSNTGLAYYFCGRIVYRDDLNIERNMAFYRILESGSHRFVPIDEPQLEYSDTNP